MDRNILSNDIPDRQKTVYAIVIFLPSHLDELIYILREKFDPLYNKLPGHITIVFPFESTQTLNDISATIMAALLNVSPIPIGLESIGDFYPHSSTIFWKLKQCQPLQQLYHSLHGSLDIPIPFKNYIPHVTVAREISSHRVLLVKERIVPYLPSEKFFAKSIDLVVPIEGDRWVSVRSFALEGGSTDD